MKRGTEGRLAALALGLALAGCSSLKTGRAQTVRPQVVTNPLLAGDHPDPFVFKWRENYYLTHTAPNGVPLFRSPDLIHWTELKNALGAGASPVQKPFLIGGKGFCHIWAAEFFPVEGDRVLLTFSAVAFDEDIPATCPPFDGNTGIYGLISNDGMEADFSATPRGTLVIGENERCEKWGTYPRSRSLEVGCPPGKCAHSFRIDGSLFADGERNFLTYTWFTNPTPRSDEEKQNHGFNIAAVEMEERSPEKTRCDSEPRPLPLVSPGDDVLLTQLKQSCRGCDSRFSFSKTQERTEWSWNGTKAGIAEGPSLFRRGEYVYLFFSHGHYDSAYYGVSWIAAKTVEGLSRPDRLAGRYLIPSGEFSYGHGSPVLGPDGKNYFYVYHRINYRTCRAQEGRQCARDIMISPLDFEDKGDGRGAIFPRPRHPETDDNAVTIETFG